MLLLWVIWGKKQTNTHTNTHAHTLARVLGTLRTRFCLFWKLKTFLFHNVYLQRWAHFMLRGYDCFSVSNSACLVMEVKCILNTAWPEYKLSLCSSLAMMLFLPSLTYNQRLSRPHGPESGSGWVGWGRVRGGDVRLGGTTRYVCVCVYKYSGCKKVSGLICSTDYAVLVAAWQCDCSGLCCFVFFRLNRILIDRVVL